MSKITTTRYDVAEHLRTPEKMAAFLEACLEEADGDASFIAKGMAQVAKEAGLSRESLYEALSGERSLDFDTILKVVGALGLRLHAEAAGSRLRALSSRASSARQSCVEPNVILNSFSEEIWGILTLKLC